MRKRGSFTTFIMPRDHARSIITTAFASLICLVLINAPLSAVSENLNGRIQVLDDMNVPNDLGPGKNGIHEISGLAYDQDEDLLYAVSDEGVLFKFKIAISNSKIASIDFVSSFSLKLKRKGETDSDTEDLTLSNASNGLMGDTLITVVFEDGPVAAQFDVNGELIKEIALPSPLNNPRVFPDKNSTVESIAYAKEHGFIYIPQTTTSENRSSHQIYAEDGMVWSYDYREEKHNNTSSVITTSNKSIMILEGSEPKGLWAQLTRSGHETHIREIDLKSCDAQNHCKTIDFAPQDINLLTDRYEGMTQVGDNLFLLATDQTAGTRLTLITLVR